MCGGDSEEGRKRASCQPARSHRRKEEERVGETKEVEIDGLVGLTARSLNSA